MYQPAVFAEINTETIAAFSSARCMRRVRIPSEWTRSARAMLVPNISLWTIIADRDFRSSTPVRVGRLRVTAHQRGKAAVNRGGGAAAQLLVDDVADEVPEVRAFAPRQQGAGAHGVNGGCHARILGGQLPFRLPQPCAGQRGGADP